MLNIRTLILQTFPAIFVFIFFISFICCINADTVQPSENASPAVPVTLAVKGESLSDVMQLLQNQSGLRLRVSKEISDQKVTVFVDNQPLRDVMKALCSLFGYKWNLVKLENSKLKVYELWEPESIRQKRQGRSKEEIDKDWNHLLTVEPDWLKLNQGNKFLNAYVRICQSLSSEDIDAIRSGYTVHYYTGTSEARWRLPDDIAKGLITDIEPEIMNDSAGISVVLSLTGPSSAGITIVREVLKADAQGRLVSVRSLNCGMFGEGVPNKEIDGIPSFNKSSFSTLNSSAVEITKDDLIRESSVIKPQSDTYTMLQPQVPGIATGIMVNRSDILALLHEKLGVQIISDHYSIFTSCEPMKGTLRTLLGESIHDPVSIDDKFIYSRVFDIHTADSEETPNRILRPIQEAYAARKTLDLPELALMGTLDLTQLRALKSKSEYLGIGYLKHLDEKSLPAIRIYGHLTTQQRQEAFNNGTPVQSFTTTQRATLIEMMDGIPVSLAPDAVGIYSRTGFRIDKSTSNEPRYPVLIGMSVLPDMLLSMNTEPSGTSLYVNIPDGVTKESATMAFQSLKQNNPKINPADFLVMDATGYEMDIKLADESVQRIRISIDEKLTPYNKFVADGN